MNGMREFRIRRPGEGNVVVDRSQNVDRYYRDVLKYDLISHEEEYELAIKSKNGDLEARDKLINSNLRFVISIAKSYIRSGVSLEDLINEGNIGLIEATKRYDPKMGFKFTSFAVWNIRQKIIQFLGGMSRTVKLPSNRIKQAIWIDRYVNEVYVSEGRMPTDEEIIENVSTKELPLDKHGLLHIRNGYKGQGSLDIKVDDSGTTLMSLKEDLSFNTERQILKAEELKHIEKYIFNLSEFERDVLTLRLGIGGEMPKSLDEIGRIYDVSGQTISNKMKRILRKVRRNAIKRSE